MENNKFSFSRLSIQQRLQFLICALLLAAIVLYGFANYYSLRKATMASAKDRLNSLTSQMTGTFGQSAEFIAKTVNNAAHQKAIIAVLAGANNFRDSAVNILNKLRRDSTWVSVELLDSNRQAVLSSGAGTFSAGAAKGEIISSLQPGVDEGKIGKIYNINGAVYYPIVSAVTGESKVTGYIIAWVTLKATPKTIAQFTELVGTGAGFYFGNTDGSLWTDLLKPLVNEPFKITKPGELVKFTGEDGARLLASGQVVPHTSWLMVIAFSEQTLLKGVTGFVKWIIIIGIVLTATGIFAAWLTSRNITKPLNQLTNAVTNVAQGNYSSSVSAGMYRSGELVRLANAFNTMAAQVQQVYETLENKVNERTLELERVNHELDSFSYSVSHDLRAPLRAITGYASILKEDYHEKLDGEGNRVIGNIIRNANTMGHLIDDLLTFSRLGKKELVRTGVDMKLLATTVADELLQYKPQNKYKVLIDELPAAEADPGMIKQVLINLVGNAIKYSSKNEGPVIEIGYTDQPAKTIYYVKDNGAGFDMAYAHKLFGVFQRLHSQEEFEGTGVGLALVKRIIERHKGEVWAESSPGKGATFYFSLPKHIVTMSVA